jgi:NAD(P)-dependent dehydrogenase (short-subunit alcohol dehydrogenase family)
MRPLSGKTAFVTGGASGIGFAMCESFLRRGMSVVVADIRQDHLDAARAALGDAASRARFLRVDVTDRKAMAAAAQETERAFGKVHLLCNNAGVGDGVPIDRAAFEDWDWVLGVNLGGVVNGLVTFIPRIKAHGEGGHILNTASMHSFIALPAWGGIYSASKFAVRGLSESLRLALAPFNIGVSVLCPGLTRTNIGESYGLRPAHLAAPPRDVQPLHPTAQVVPPPPGSGMDPAEIGEIVARGIERNEFYLLTHPEHREELGALFDEALGAFPASGPVDAGRRAFEEARRTATAAAKALMPRG